MYPHVRFDVRLATCASLIAFAGIVGIGTPILLSRALERPLVVSAEAPDPAALSNRGTPPVAERGVAEHGVSNAGTLELPPAAATAPVKRAAEIRHTATVTAEPLPQNELTAPEHAIPLQPSAAAPEKPAAETRHAATAAAEAPPQNELTAPEQTTPMQPPAAGRAHVARPASRTKAHLPALKKTARREGAAKRRTNEALNSVRRFGDTVHDIPANAYASDGTQRRIVIRPTSIQDVYYYSVPR